MCHCPSMRKKNAQVAVRHGAELCYKPLLFRQSHILKITLILLSWKPNKGMNHRNLTCLGVNVADLEFWFEVNFLAVFCRLFPYHESVLCACEYLIFFFCFCIQLLRCTCGTFHHKFESFLKNTIQSRAEARVTIQKMIHFVF